MTKITLVAVMDDVWRATIECTVIAPKIDGIEGQVIETTNIASESRSYECGIKR